MQHSTILLVLITFAIASDKINLDSLNNYSEFLNYGEKKLVKLKKESLENSIIKSKIDVLGEIFKTNIDVLKAWSKLDLVFLIDASSSVGEVNFRSELKFVRKLLSDVTVDYNHTRVAIVTFSSPNQITTNIDEISNPKKENNKCLLLNKQLNKIKYTGGGTYTLGAFEQAKRIFEKARNDSKKALFLITDGFSNNGDPVPLANELKNQSITVFTVGIQNGNYRELYELSSSPGEIHSYLLDSFREFESLARRALHVDLKTGDYIPLGISSPCNELCENGNCCDKNAVCTCGTSTGHYSCVCQPGFYGSGLTDSCIPCPSGSYSDGPNLCIPCPDLYHVTKAPAIGIESCKCKPGYKSNKDNQCETLKCPKIALPDHGYFVKKRDCYNVLNSACGIRCEVGYTLVGNSIRLCQINATWSGEEPSCQIKNCPRLPVPLYGTINCSHADLGVTYNDSEEHLPVDSVCDFQCEEGKTLIGSSQRTCLPLARWDGLKTSCKQIKCPKLPNIKNAKIEPKSCQIGKQSYGKKCEITCNEGYILEGPSLKTCTGNHGLWDSKFEDTFCKDAIPPNITCPENITSTTMPGKKFGTVFWNQPEITDNSDLEMSIWMKPSIKNITGFRFKIGTTQVTYFAKDAFKNQNKCSFYVTIEDHEKPTIEECLSPPTFLTNDQKGANLSWDEPNIFDNSQNVKVNKSHEFGFFPVGTTEVIYIATDRTGNNNSCTLNITVEEAHCEALPDPIYGHSKCLPENDGMQCVITCQEGYAVPLTQPQNSLDPSISFICNNSESVWYNQEGLLFPECSITEIPREVEQNGTINISTDLDSCNDTKLADLENDVKLTLQKETCQENCTVNTETICEDEEEEQNNIIKRDTNFEPIPHRNRRKGRKKKINVKFQVKGILVNQTTPSEINGQKITIKYDNPAFICPLGFIPRKNRCVQCPKGTFHNSTRNKCQSCDFGFYNDELGKITCKSCPLHYSTKKMHSKRLEDCKQQCPPGTHARKKLIKHLKRHPSLTIERKTLKPICRSCPIGYYQPEFNQLRCLPCPKGYTTTSIGSFSISHCQLTASESCNKPNICNFGECVPENDFQYSCNCLKDYFGEHCDKKLNPCNSNPCFNNATCQSTSSGFSCFCPKGTFGKLCENSEDCPLKCLNNGVCHQNDLNDQFCLCPDGFNGDLCENRQNFCEERICENNSTCLELNGGFKCQCQNGFIGKRCNILPCDFKPCKNHQICINKIEENATRTSYICECPGGFKGDLCEEKLDFCRINPCLNGGTCTSNEANFDCNCLKSFYGRKCEFARDSNYTLHFQKFSTSDFIQLKGFSSNLTQITACLWIQTQDSFNYGTLLSYATKKYDNSFTLTDYTGLVVYINNEYAVTDVLLNDGLWHHVCVSWENAMGSYRLYVDSKLLKNGVDLARNTEIEGSGNMVIGQEQDILGGKFSQSESFVGKIAHFDVWSRQLSFEEIQKHFEDCQEGFFGNIYGWPEIKENIKGDIKVETSFFCTKCSNPKLLYNGFVDVINNTAYYSCDKGYQLNSDKYIRGRKCTKASKWEGIYEPFCRKIYCGYPGFVRNAYITGNKYFYEDQVTYNCFDGYNLEGTATLICKETGKWFPDKPHCSGLQCMAFKKPENSNLTVIAEHSYEDFIENKSIFDIGTQVEIVCHTNANLTGENVITCQDNGTWDFEPPQCLLENPESFKLPCSLDLIPTPPVNGYIVLESLYEAGNGTNNVIEYKCRNGYKLHGDNTTTCIIDGYWSETNLSCDPILCKQPKFTNMFVKEEINQEFHKYGNMIKFECIEGYRMFGDSAIRCLASGKWSRMKAKCTKKSCRKPIVSESTLIEGNSYFYEDQVTITCLSKSQFTLTCNSYGMWIGERDDTC